MLGSESEPAQCCHAESPAPASVAPVPRRSPCADSHNVASLASRSPTDVGLTQIPITTTHMIFHKVVGRASLKPLPQVLVNSLCLPDFSHVHTTSAKFRTKVSLRHSTLLSELFQMRYHSTHASI
ncbi:hypothetical protein J6590_068058 [Homalodisca vitripennis]|nr:hypothetical protein J6590_068058 [Homalodisca vitripennis]